jgi:HPt (histidine-containing phosphotransfer) domain-containing protein
MDAYVSKPMTAAALCTTIDQLLGQDSSQTVPVVAPAVDVSKVLQTVEGDRALLAELVQAFNRGYPARVAEVHEAITRGDDKRLERAAHVLTGEVGLFGAQMAYHLAEMLETMGREGRFENASRILQDLEHELERIISFFDQVGWKTPV